jgi:hypothetical protein
VHARKRGVESFEKREKDVKRGKNKEKICVWKSKKEKRKNNKKKYVYDRDESSERKK